MLMFGLGAYAAVTYVVGSKLFPPQGIGSGIMFALSPVTVPLGIVFMFVVYGH